MARRLAAILAADVVGYSRLMAADEIGTLAALKAHRANLFDPETARHSGRIVKLMGDGVLVEFPSVVDAVECALAIQTTMAGSEGKIRLRIGINLGDIIIDGDDIYGDGVNVAARLEPLAEPGGIAISSMVREGLGNRVDVEFFDAGEHQVKNIDRPIRVFRWPSRQGPLPSTPATPALAPSYRPSIAVLPFADMSDSDEESFADGICEDLITELSRFRSLFVISRNSTFAFKGQNFNLKDTSKKLGARYILEGRVRRAGERLRITAQLIDAVDDAHLWANRYDWQVEDIFAAQDEVVKAILSEIEPQLTISEQKRALSKPPERLDAWENYQRATWHMLSYNAEERETTLAFFERAIELDPRLAAAHAGLGMAIYFYTLLGASPDSVRDTERALKATKMAVSLDEQDPFAHVALALCHLLRGQHETATEASDRAIRLNPSYAMAHFGLGHALWHQGRLAEAITSLDDAITLNPRDSLLWAYMASKAVALALKTELEEAIVWSRQAQQQPNATIFCHVGEICALGLLGRKKKAADAVARAKRTMSNVTIRYLDTVLPITDPKRRGIFLKGLKEAGLPQ